MTYSAQQVADKLNVSIRAVQKRCVRHNITKGINGFEIPVNIYYKWSTYNERKNIQSTVRNQEVEQLQKQIEDLRLIVTRHNKLFRLLGDRLQHIEELKNVNIENDASLNVIKNKPTGMNDINFESNFNKFKQ